MKKVFLLLAALAGLASCHKTGNKQAEKVSPQDSTVLYVALMPTVDCLPFYYAEQQGIFDSLNANIEIRNYMAQMDCDTAFCRKHVDVAYTDLIRAALLQSKDTALNVIMRTDGSHELITAFSKRLKSPSVLIKQLVKNVHIMNIVMYRSD